MAAIDKFSTGSVVVYGGALGEMPGGCQDYTAPIQLKGVRIVDENWLRQIVESHAALLGSCKDLISCADPHRDRMELRAARRYVRAGEKLQ